MFHKNCLMRQLQFTPPSKLHFLISRYQSSIYGYMQCNLILAWFCHLSPKAENRSDCLSVWQSLYPPTARKVLNINRNSNWGTTDTSDHNCSLEESCSEVLGIECGDQIIKRGLHPRASRWVVRFSKETPGCWVLLKIWSQYGCWALLKSDT